MYVMIQLIFIKRFFKKEAINYIDSNKKGEPFKNNKALSYDEFSKTVRMT